MIAFMNCMPMGMSPLNSISKCSSVIIYLIIMLFITWYKHTNFFIDLEFLVAEMIIIVIEKSKVNSVRLSYHQFHSAEWGRAIMDMTKNCND